MQAILLLIFLLARAAALLDREVVTLAAGFSATIGGLAVDDAAGVVYVADTANHAIKAVTVATGATRTVAGGAQGFVDGPCSVARFSSPWGIVFDARALYVAEYGGHRVRRVVFSSDPTRREMYAGNPTRSVYQAASEGNNVTFSCAKGAFRNVTFARYGTPELNPRMREYASDLDWGPCGAGADPATVYAVVKSACEGKSFCTLGALPATFGVPDPCPNVLKHLMVGLSGCPDVEEQCVVNSVVGKGLPGGDDGWGVASSFRFPKGITMSRTPNINSFEPTLWVTDNCEAAAPSQGFVRSLKTEGYSKTIVISLSSPSAIVYAFPHLFFVDSFYNVRCHLIKCLPCIDLTFLTQPNQAGSDPYDAMLLSRISKFKLRHPGSLWKTSIFW
jgi:hypothetical protein